MGTLTIRQLDPAENFLLALHASMSHVGGVDLEMSSRTDQPRSVDLS